jgi:hypothetical protein
MLILGIVTQVEARQGQTSSSSPSKTSKSSSSTKLGKSFFSKNSASSSKTALNTAFGKTAKNKQAKTAWMDYNKSKTSSNAVASPLQNSTTELTAQLVDLKKQLETEKNRANNDRLVSQIALIAQQIASTRKQQPVTNRMLFTQPEVSRSTNFPATTAPSRNIATQSAASSHRGMSIFWIIVIVAGGVILIIWLVKRNQPTTIYRI